MNYEIQELKEEDIEQIEEFAPFLALCIRFHGDWKKENIVCLRNEVDQVVGIGAMVYDYTWFANEDYTGKQRINLEYATKEQGIQKHIVEHSILTELKKRINNYINEDSQKNKCLNCWCMEDEKEKIQFLLEEGFEMYGLIPIMKLDMGKVWKHFNIPEGIIIEPLEFTADSMKDYLHVTALAQDGLQDSESATWFMAGGPHFQTFVAKAGETMVGAISIWEISKERAATENIFVIPGYRRKNIAKELIVTALEEIKRQGYQYATLSVVGTNRIALNLYCSMGYEYCNSIYEMHYNY